MRNKSGNFVTDTPSKHARLVRRINLSLAVASILCFLGSLARAAEVPWWDPNWPYRVGVECEAGQGDVAVATLNLAGRTTEDGRDLRIIDANGRLCPFEIIHHDHELSTLLQFRVPPDEPRTVWVYFGHRNARIIETAKLGAGSGAEASIARSRWKNEKRQREALLQQQGLLQKQLDELGQSEKAAVAGNTPPEMIRNLRINIQLIERQLKAIRIPPETAEPDDPGKWYPRRGLILRVYRKAGNAHPKTLEDLRKLIHESTLEGAGFRMAVSDGFNPFGTSDQYISVYEGYLRIDEPGTYSFCSASDDGSWIVVNNRTILEWPGPHGYEGSQRGQKKGRINLDKEVAHIQYYHEEGEEEQLAFLGWQPPGAEQFTAIPTDQWASVRPAGVGKYETRRQNPIMAQADVRVVNTYWVPETQGLQATLVECMDQSESRAGKITRRQWSFGDGLTGRGKKVRHVYFRTTRPDITLTATDAKGNSDTVTCSPNIFLVDVKSNYFNYGNAKQYIKAADGYDVDNMPCDDLANYAEFWGQLEQWPQHVRAVRALIQRCGSSESVPRLVISAARACTKPQAYDPKLAEELLQKAIKSAEEPSLRRNLLLEHARLLAWNLADYEPAKRIYNKLLPSRDRGNSKGTEAMTRSCLIGLGDLALLSADYPKAEQLYRQAADYADQKIEQPEELAKSGSFAYTVEDLLARDELDWAAKTIDQWEEQFPVQKLEGYSFFLRGKVLFVEHPGPQALRYLELAEKVAPQAIHVPEAVWLRANCLMALNRYSEALDQFLRIRTEFTQSEFFEQAEAKIKECQAKHANVENRK